MTLEILVNAAVRMLVVGAAACVSDSRAKNWYFSLSWLFGNATISSSYFFCATA